MRTIEEKIIDALNGNNGEGIKKLSCRDCVEVNGGTKRYYLWNNLIFWNNDSIYYFSGRGWNSLTTKSRLTAILGSFFDASITQKKYKWFLNWNGKKYPVGVSSIYMLKGKKYPVSVSPIYMLKGNKLYRLGAHEEEVKPL